MTKGKTLLVLTGDKGAHEFREILLWAMKEIGGSELARRTGIPRGHLYKMLSPQGNPTMASILKLVEALELQLALDKNG